MGIPGGVVLTVGSQGSGKCPSHLGNYPLFSFPLLLLHFLNLSPVPHPPPPPPTPASSLCFYSSSSECIIDSLAVPLSSTLSILSCASLPSSLHSFNTSLLNTSFLAPTFPSFPSTPLLFLPHTFCSPSFCPCLYPRCPPEAPRTGRGSRPASHRPQKARTRETLAGLRLSMLHAHDRTVGQQTKGQGKNEYD